MLATLRILMHMGSLQRLAPFWVLGLATSMWWGSAAVILALVYGVLLQFFVEYVMHRFLYHREPPTDQGLFNDLYRTHIGHHEFPADPEFFTGDDHWFVVRFALVSATLHVAVFWPILGLQNAALFTSTALFVGSVSAFAFYEYCHTLAHLNVPKGWFGQKVTHSHMRHHFNDHDSNFHVSLGMGWIDRIFGTSYDKESAKDRYDPKTILSLGMDPEDLRLVTARKAFGLSAKPRRDRSGTVARP